MEDEDFKVDEIEMMINEIEDLNDLIEIKQYLEKIIAGYYQ